MACTPTQADLSQIMLPDDANPGGTVHGGVLLHLVDQVGFLAATRYANQGADEARVATLARIEQCEFHSPMHIGELAQAHAEVTHVSAHSMEVVVTVTAVNPLTGKERRTNTARAWYVARPFSGIKGPKTAAVALPPMQYESGEAAKAGQQRYELQKQQRQSNSDVTAVELACLHVRKSMAPGSERVPHTVAAAASTLSHVTLPSECAACTHFVRAGVIMKLMVCCARVSSLQFIRFHSDLIAVIALCLTVCLTQPLLSSLPDSQDNAAAIAAARHCLSHIVTVSVESMDFHHPVKSGSVVTLYSWPTFSSARSIEIEVAVFAESLLAPPVLCSSSRFTFVAIDEQRKSMQVPALMPVSPEETSRFELGRARYEARKQARVQPPAKDGAATVQSMSA
eukprot:m.43983 g.43983  ORF g.43983 m.43983 type:complete len:397 (+) comp5807_c1_seq2:64-1254(+)